MKDLEKKESRRKHISFKNNVADKSLLEHLEKKSSIYGLSYYIKLLIQKDMYQEQKK